MTVKEASPVGEKETREVSVQAGEAAEAAHLAGSAIVTGAVAALLTVIAIPVSIGIGVAWGVKAIARRARGE